MEKKSASYNHWFLVRVNGRAMGYVHETLEAEARPSAGAQTSPVIRIVSQMKMVMNRLGVKIEIGLDSESEESPAGQLLFVRFNLQASVMSTLTEVTVDPEHRTIRISKKSGAGPDSKPYVNVQEYRGDLLGLEAARRLSASRLKNPGDTMSFQTFSAELEKVVTVNRKVLAKEIISTDGTGGSPVAALKVEESTSGQAAKQTAWFDEQGYLLKQQEPSPLGSIEVVRSDETRALSSVAGVEMPEEILSRSLIRSNIRLPQPRSLDRMRVKITQIDPSLGRPDLERPHQTVLERGDSGFVVEIRRADPQKAGSEKIPELVAKHETGATTISPELAEYVLPNAYIQSDDPDIMTTARKIVGGETSLYRAVKMLERWVAENMTFDLGIVFAPSVEILKNKRGTCVGYATLLATLARAAGIPSRIVLGLVYTHGMFGGHAWAEIYAGGDWIPFDAAIPSDGPADAARIAVVSSSLREGVGSINAGVGEQIFGNVRIDILEFGSSGKRTLLPAPGKDFYVTAARKDTVVPAGAKPYLISGDRYENPWLGLSLEKPAGYKFNKLDAIWPDMTVVSMEGPNKEIVKLLQINLMPWWDQKTIEENLSKSYGNELGRSLGKKDKSSKPKSVRASGRESYLFSSDTASVLIIPDGMEAWILMVEGQGESGLMSLLLKTIELRD